MLDQRHGDPFGVAVDRSTLALVGLRVGRPREALALVCDMTLC
jgi:hypothetical protein